jgi:hypothetical protein
LFGIPEYLEHVVTWSIEQLLESQLERMRPRPADPSTDDFEFHDFLPVTAHAEDPPSI